MTGEILAVSVAVMSEGRVLLVRRGQPPSPGLYAFPGGRVEPGETLVEAARRELAEETGITVAALEPLREVRIEAKRDGVPVVYRLTVFRGHDPDGPAIAGTDADEAEYFDAGQIARLDVTPSVLEIVREMIGPI